MKINLVNTATGFKPATDEDYEKKCKLKIGQMYETTVKEVRNPKFHRLYFSLLNCAWEYLSERQQEFFRHDKDSFRKSVEITAGHYELVYSVTRKMWVEIPKSIAFDKLSESDFHKLYERVKDVIYQIFIPDVNKEEFENNLMYY